MSDPAALHANVYGRVQGVYYRAFTRRMAAGLGLSGYVRNMPGGTVEVWAEGDKAQLRRLISHLESGPPAARVEKVVTRWAEYTGNYNRFSII